MTPATRSARSAGILLYRTPETPETPHRGVEVLLVHPGGPFWARKDEGAWSIPKGLVDDGESEWAAACREFAEELGAPVPDGPHLELGEVRLKSGKVVVGFAVAGDFDVADVHSNTFEMAWPPKSGRMQSFPEVDRAEWFVPGRARTKLNPAQVPFVDRLLTALG